jgi:ABC-type glycerol-3-phosphate transport system substrate-binding protein
MKKILLLSLVILWLLAFVGCSQITDAVKSQPINIPQYTITQISENVLKVTIPMMNNYALLDLDAALAELNKDYKINGIVIGYAEYLQRGDFYIVVQPK